jgi:hypothetical protein
MWWVKKWGKDKYCSITQSRLRSGFYRNGMKRCIFLDCGHGFYTKPLLEWIQKDERGTCPYCRQVIHIDKMLPKLLYK